MEEEQIEEKKKPEEEEKSYLVNDLYAHLTKQKEARKKQIFSDEFLAV